MSCEIERAVIALGGEPYCQKWGGKASETDILAIYEGVYVWVGKGARALQDPDYKVICTHAQFLAKRAELENRPTEWPEGYDWRWQNGDGSWKFGKGPKPERRGAVGGHYVTDIHKNGGQGICFGNWQDSLQRRPVELQENTADAEWVPGVDLPPIGTVCQTLDDIGSRVECEILAHAVAKGKPVAIYQRTEPAEFEDDVGWAIASCFSRPKSHRDQCIEAALAVPGVYNSYGPERTVELLANADMLKLPEDGE